MAETDILNPVAGWWDVLGDNPNWSYGWTRKTATNKRLARPRLGRRYSRELLNAGYSMTLNWIDRPYSTVLYLKKFYEQFQGGYFTLIDRDGGGRHHVGNFTSEPVGVETANDKYTVQGLIFEECPQARMLIYPSDFAASSHLIYSVDDYLEPLVATQGAWTPQLAPTMAGTSLSAPSSYEMLNAAPVAGDFAQIEYVGWGFQMLFRSDPLLGMCDIYIDGSIYIAGLDLSTGNGPGVAGGLIQKVDLPLDKHRIKVVAKATTGASSTANGVIYPYVQVIH